MSASNSGDIAVKVAPRQPVDWVGLTSSAAFIGTLGTAMGLRRDNKRSDKLLKTS